MNIRQCLLLFAALPLLAQAGQSQLGAIDRSVGGGFDRSVHAEPGQNGSVSGGGKGEAHASTSRVATQTRSALANPSRSSRGNELLPQAGRGQKTAAAVTQQATHSGQGSEKKRKPAEPAASSFGGDASGTSKFAFTGKVGVGGSSSSTAKTMRDKQFAAETRGQGGGMRRHKARHVKSKIAPKGGQGWL